MKNATGDCTQGAFPSVVVNATTVAQVQGALNFARKKNLRLVIKNTGHDSIGRNVGAGSLSVFMHHLGGFEFLPDYIQPGGLYRGPAARIGTGSQVVEINAKAALHNITLLGGTCATVATYGGWTAGGGHGTLSSKYSLGSDQILSLQVVTADGEVVTADPETNPDLFFALRGGGPSTYGIVTSVIVRAYPPITLTTASFVITATNQSAPTTNNTTTPIIASPATFWSAFSTLLAFAPPTVDASGYLWTNVSRFRGTLRMEVRVQMPGLSTSEFNAHAAQLVTAFRNLGISLPNPLPFTSSPYSLSTTTTAFAPGNGVFASRLVPRTVFTDPAAFAKLVATVRAAIENGYIFPGLMFSATLKVAGFPPASGVNPVFRDAIMHGNVVEPRASGVLSEQEYIEVRKQLTRQMNAVRAVTPGGGAYLNEADWQRSFYGGNYERLVEIKRRWDPEGVFWARMTPGSEAWAVEGIGRIPTQNGRLCRVGV